MGKDGMSPMTLAEWVDALVSDAPHLFEANAGSGAAGSGSGGAGNRSVKNPFRKESLQSHGTNETCKNPTRSWRPV